MKKYIKSSKNESIGTYKGIPMYRDVTSNDIYIYRRKHGEGRINFPNERECKDYINDNLDDIKCTRNVMLRNAAIKSSTDRDRFYKGIRLVDDPIEWNEEEWAIVGPRYCKLMTEAAKKYIQSPVASVRFFIDPESIGAEFIMIDVKYIDGSSEVFEGESWDVLQWNPESADSDAEMLMDKLYDQI